LSLRFPFFVFLRNLPILDDETTTATASPLSVLKPLTKKQRKLT